MSFNQSNSHTCPNYQGQFERFYYQYIGTIKSPNILLFLGISHYCSQFYIYLISLLFFKSDCFLAFQTIISNFIKYFTFNITILIVDLFLDISYCPQSFLYCFKREIGSTANVHTISCQVISKCFPRFL